MGGFCLVVEFHQGGSAEKKRLPKKKSHRLYSESDCISPPFASLIAGMPPVMHWSQRPSCIGSVSSCSLAPMARISLASVFTSLIRADLVRSRTLDSFFTCLLVSRRRSSCSVPLMLTLTCSSVEPSPWTPVLVLAGTRSYSWVLESSWLGLVSVLRVRSWSWSCSSALGSMSTRPSASSCLPPWGPLLPPWSTPASAGRSDTHMMPPGLTSFSFHLWAPAPGAPGSFSVFLAFLSWPSGSTRPCFSFSPP